MANLPDDLEGFVRYEIMKAYHLFHEPDQLVTMNSMAESIADHLAKYVAIEVTVEDVLKILNSTLKVA